MSIFKRIFGDKDDTNNNASQIFKSPHNHNVKSMGHSLQKRFSRGVQYNMKILIRGDRNVGKSALLTRLKGMDFLEQYIPTDEIEVASIHWNYKNIDDVVKVEVWDVVDKGRKKVNGGLKLENNNTNTTQNLCLDAGFLDVYKGAHGVILMFDMTKSWTLQYIEKELPLVPEDIPVLILANHRDMGHHRTISSDQVVTLIESVLNNRSDDKGTIRYWESSMKNGYGLLYIHRFLGIPFLKLQRNTLLSQLQTNEEESKMTQFDLNNVESNPESTYDHFIQCLKNAKINSERPKPEPSQSEDASSRPPNSLGLRSTPVSQINSPTSPLDHAPVASTPDQPHIPTRHVPQARPIPGMERLGLYPLPVPSNAIIANTKENVSNENNAATDNKVGRRAKKSSGEVYDFMPPDDTGLSSFLEDVPQDSNKIIGGGIGVTIVPPVTKQHKTPKYSEDSSEDEYEDASGPVIAAFQDELDEEDFNVTRLKDHNPYSEVSVVNVLTTISSSNSSPSSTRASTPVVQHPDLHSHVQEQLDPSKSIVQHPDLYTHVQEQLDPSKSPPTTTVSVVVAPIEEDDTTESVEDVRSKKSKKKSSSTTKNKKKSKKDRSDDQTQESKVVRKKSSDSSSNSKKKKSKSKQQTEEIRENNNEIDSEDALEKFLNE